MEEGHDHVANFPHELQRTFIDINMFHVRLFLPLSYSSQAFSVRLVPPRVVLQSPRLEQATWASVVGAECCGWTQTPPRPFMRHCWRQTSLAAQTHQQRLKKSCRPSCDKLCFCLGTFRTSPPCWHPSVETSSRSRSESERPRC